MGRYRHQPNGWSVFEHRDPRVGDGQLLERFGESLVNGFALFFQLRNGLERTP